MLQGMVTRAVESSWSGHHIAMTELKPWKRVPLVVQVSPWGPCGCLHHRRCRHWPADLTYCGFSDVPNTWNSCCKLSGMVLPIAKLAQCSRYKFAASGCGIGKGTR
jgi:hypothetical protein